VRAAWYERQGPAAAVLVVGEMPTPQPGPHEVLVHVATSGINPGDVKKRQDMFGVGMPYPRVIPHSDGAGVIEEVGDKVSRSRIGERVWCFGAQSYRPFGTAAEYVVVPTDQAVPLPAGVSFEQGACLGIPGITAHRAVHVAGPVRDRTVLVQGGAGAVGQCAVALAQHAGANVLATVRSEEDRAVATRAGAHHVLVANGVSGQEAVDRIRAQAPDGIDHIVEVAFDANLAADEQVLRLGGSIATYATGDPAPTVPFWPLVFKNVAIFFLGSDDFPAAAKVEAARSLNEALEQGWSGFDIYARLPLEQIAAAHEMVERRTSAGRVVLNLGAPFHAGR
jgi:NADPH2:quinone reductase